MTESSKQSRYGVRQQIQIGKYLLVKTDVGYWIECDDGEAMGISYPESVDAFEKMIERFYNEHF